MNRFIAVIFAVVMSVSFAINANAAQSQIMVTGNDNSVTISFSDEEQSTKSQSIKSLIANLDEISKGEAITQKLTVSGDSEQSVKVYLRLEVQKPYSDEQSPVKATPEPVAEDDNVLDYYDIVIKDVNGETIYDFNAADKTSALVKFKDIELGEIDAENKPKDYEITISQNESLKNMANEAAMIDWMIVTDGYSSVNKPVISTMEPNEAEAQLDGNIIERSLRDGTYTVGKDLLKGRYDITGEATVKVYTDDGELKTKIILTHDSNSQTGVDNYVLNLSNGEVVEVSGEADFKPYTPTKSKATAKPLYGTDSSKNQVKATTAPKTNPKTGDMVPVGVIMLIGAMAIVSFLALEYKKRKNN